MVFTIIIVFLSLLVLMVIHEFGHFIIAKKFGVKVEEFGIGYPPRIFGKKIGETIYSLNLLPFGAFVRVHGEEERIESAHSFSEKPVWQRLLIVVGGVMSFWIIAAILLSIVFAAGVPEAVDDETNQNLVNPTVQIVEIAPNSPAQIAGLEIGDIIKGAKTQDSDIQTTKVKEVQDFINENLGKEITLTIQKGKEIKDISLIPRVSPPKEEGPLGIALLRVVTKKYPIWLAPIKGVKATFDITVFIVEGLFAALVNAIRGLPTGVQLMGPVGVGSLMFQAVQIGVLYFLQFIGIISIYFAVFNILPIPAVDGGKILFLLIEKIKGRPIKREIEQKINAVCFMSLVILAIFVTIKDIARLF